MNYLLHKISLHLRFISDFLKHLTLKYQKESELREREREIKDKGIQTQAWEIKKKFYQKERGENFN